MVATPIRRGTEPGLQSAWHKSVGPLAREASSIFVALTRLMPVDGSFTSWSVSVDVRLLRCARKDRGDLEIQRRVQGRSPCRGRGVSPHLLLSPRASRPRGMQSPLQRYILRQAQDALEASGGGATTEVGHFGCGIGSVVQKERDYYM
jgi:hypothetical protein